MPFDLSFGIICLGAAVALGLLIMLIVTIGAGVSSHKHSKIRRRMASAVRHLNGEADPPAGLVAFFEEMPTSARSAFSAKSATSATENPAVETSAT
ncbi:MAG: hypothetical protein FWG47_02960 [Propionibacteriaceae bacterium]|nr:hypothetical protein [Propionibacteriaceae bacterium]